MKTYYIASSSGTLNADCKAGLKVIITVTDPDGKAPGLVEQEPVQVGSQPASQAASRRQLASCLLCVHVFQPPLPFYHTL